ncbi:hypothetical protein HAX54_053520 [Datura stramonium]|uniref:Uncharacterized protein n=1 Tax=Datura stramonium TaxID=4076 RepID=A0ABS8T0K4_DATST|nr:hypothetical protein [Datura stramonium]
MPGASIIVEQVYSDFALGSAITKTIIGNPAYQARYLEKVCPGVNRIILWTALHPNGCYQMCLTDNYFHNLPAGNIVDNLLKQWQTGVVHGETDQHGSFSLPGFLGEYKVTVNFGNRIANSTFSHYIEVMKPDT